MTKRRQIPARLIEWLNQGQVRYEIVHHPVAYTSQELAAIEGVKGQAHAKVVMAKAVTRLFLLVLPAPCRVDWAKVSTLLGAPATLAAEADFRELFPDCDVGTMPPVGQLYGVEMFVAARFAQNEKIAFEAGTHSDAIKMNFADYARLAHITLADFAS